MNKDIAGEYRKQGSSWNKFYNLKVEHYWQTNKVLITVYYKKTESTILLDSEVDPDYIKKLKNVEGTSQEKERAMRKVAVEEEKIAQKKEMMKRPNTYQYLCSPNNIRYNDVIAKNRSTISSMTRPRKNRIDFSGGPRITGLSGRETLLSISISDPDNYNIIQDKLTEIGEKILDTANKRHEIRVKELEKAIEEGELKPGATLEDLKAYNNKKENEYTLSLIRSPGYLRGGKKTRRRKARPSTKKYKKNKKQKKRATTKKHKKNKKYKKRPRTRKR